ncbi:hypothetical protein [Spirillospora sp. NPDC048819]|uniref:hypothetical protein n=1 Tax=Spirillospora sp. NPDC048819 TaxID=3155268 RepID=UPI0033EF41F5
MASRRPSRLNAIAAAPPPREPFPEVGVAGVFGADQLHRHLASAGRLPQEHLAHAALAEAGVEPVGADRAGVAGA